MPSDWLTSRSASPWAWGTTPCWYHARSVGPHRHGQTLVLCPPQPKLSRVFDEDQICSSLRRFDVSTRPPSDELSGLAIDLRARSAIQSTIGRTNQSQITINQMAC